MADQSEVHNKLAGRIVREIVEEVVGSGGSWINVMVVTESVLVGVALAGVKLGGDEKMLDLMVDRARKRLAEIRLTDIEPAGNA